MGRGPFAFALCFGVLFGMMASMVVVDLDDPKCSYNRLPYELRLWLDHIDDNHSAVTDICLCQTSSPLEGESFELVCLDDIASIINVQTHVECSPTPLFGKDIVRDKGGVGECWLAKVLPDERLEILESYDDLAAHHEPGTAFLQVGNTNAQIQVEVYVSSKARSGNLRVWWGLHCCYNALKLTTYKSMPFKWVYQSKDAWVKAFEV